MALLKLFWTITLESFVTTEFSSISIFLRTSGFQLKGSSFGVISLWGDWYWDAGNSISIRNYRGRPNYADAEAVVFYAAINSAGASWHVRPRKHSPSQVDTSRIKGPASGI